MKMCKFFNAYRIDFVSIIRKRLEGVKKNYNREKIGGPSRVHQRLAVEKIADPLLSTGRCPQCQGDIGGEDDQGTDPATRAQGRVRDQQGAEQGGNENAAGGKDCSLDG